MISLVVLDAAAQLIFTRPGTGDRPEASDEIHYRVSERYAGSKSDLQNEEHTERASVMEPWTTQRDHLLDMRPGELRRYRWTGMDGYTADHFGGRTMTFIDEVELISVTPHHDALPDDLHIGTYPLSVRRNGLVAALPGPLVHELVEVRLRGDRVELEGVAQTSAGLTEMHLGFTLDELRARMTTAEARDANEHRHWDAALAAADRAIALAPAVDAAYVQRARALIGTHRADEALATLAPVIARDPVWLYAQLAGDKALAPLLDTPPLRALVAATPGTLLADYRVFAVETEPTGRFLAIYDDGAAVDGMRQYCGTMTVIDRATAATVAELPTGTCEAKSPPGPAQRAVAEKTFRALGFRSATGEQPRFVPVDEYSPWTQRVDVAGRRIDVANLPLPPRAQLAEGILVGDILVMHWEYESAKGELPARTAWAKLPPPAPPAPPAPPPPQIHYIDKVILDDDPPPWPLALLGIVAVIDLLLSRRSSTG